MVESIRSSPEWPLRQNHCLPRPLLTRARSNALEAPLPDEMGASAAVVSRDLGRLPCVISDQDFASYNISLSQLSAKDYTQSDLGGGSDLARLVDNIFQLNISNDVV